MFKSFTAALANNQDVIIRKAVGFGSIAAGVAINSMLNKPSAPKTVVVVEVEETVREDVADIDQPLKEEPKK